MRFFVTPEKVEKLEKKMEDFVGDPSMAVMRELAESAGTLLSMGVAIIPVRMTLTEIFKFIRPAQHDEGYDARLPKTEEMLGFMRFWMDTRQGGKGNLRKWNMVGSPIEPDMRLANLQLVVDAGTMVGYRMDGVLRPLAVPREVSLPHKEGSSEHHVHKEVGALLAAVQQEGPTHRQLRVLAKVDASATVAAVRKGGSNSEVVNEMVKALWDETLRWGWQLSCVHVPGDEMVELGVDGASRLHEFKVAPRVVKAHGRCGAGRRWTGGHQRRQRSCKGSAAWEEVKAALATRGQWPLRGSLCGQCRR
jgi:hypothetical protein